MNLLAESKRLKRRMSCCNMLFHVLPNSVKNICRRLQVDKCMICDSITCTKTVECENDSCRAHYCFECFVDSGQKCLVCTTSSPVVQRPTHVWVVPVKWRVVACCGLPSSPAVTGVQNCGGIHPGCQLVTVLIQCGGTWITWVGREHHWIPKVRRLISHRCNLGNLGET